MPDGKVTETILKFLEADLVATKQIAQSAIQIAQENKETSAVLKVHLDNINTQFTGFRGDMNNLVETAKTMFVPKAEFTPVKNLVYGTVAIIGAAFLGMLTYVIGWKL